MSGGYWNGGDFVQGDIVRGDNIWGNIVLIPFLSHRWYLNANVSNNKYISVRTCKEYSYSNFPIYPFSKGGLLKENILVRILPWKSNHTRDNYIALHIRLLNRKMNVLNICMCTPGGSLGFLGGRIRSLSKLKNTHKALISGQKSTLILIKC